jgi:uncharacterized membrane protein (GlpM family)
LSLGAEQKSSTNLCGVIEKEAQRSFLSCSSSINVISPKNTSKSQVFVTELSSKLSESTIVPLRIETSDEIKKIPNHRKSINVLVVETFTDFCEVYRKLSDEVFKFDGFFFIFLVKGEIPEVQEMFELLWQLQIYNANVMFEDKSGEVLVKTFMPFSIGKCGDTTPVLINKFKDGKFQNSDELFPKKFKNLHNCPIRAGVVTDNEPFIIERFLPDGTRVITGRDIDLLMALSKSLNFGVEFSYIGKYSPDENLVGPLSMMLNNKTDLSISNWWLKQKRVKFFDFTNPYGRDQVVFVVPPGKKFTALEKLIYPFTLASWFLILMVFLIGMLVIVVVKFQSKTTRDFVFGTGIETPLLNLFAAFIGGAQRKLPGRNFARFLLMMFLIYSLIIRTVYQASFYKLMQSNAKHREVQSLDEMIEKDFKFYIHMANEDLLRASKGISKR